jgi:hypothetical protein
VEKQRDEGVQLKVLQTALTLMQSPVLAEDEVGAQPSCSPVEMHHNLGSLRCPLTRCRAH